MQVENNYDVINNSACRSLRPVFTGVQNDARVGHPCSRPVSTFTVYRSLRRHRCLSEQRRSVSRWIKKANDRGSVVRDAIWRTRCVKRGRCYSATIHTVDVLSRSSSLVRIPSSRQRPSSDGCPDDKREDHQNCSVYCIVDATVVHNDTQTYEQFLKFTIGLHLGFRRFMFAFCVFCHYVPVLLAFIVLDFISLVLCQEIGWEEH